jgi:transposase
MKRPYVKEGVRILVVRLLQKGYTYAATAEAFGIGPATVNRIWRKYRETGETSLQPRGGESRPTISAGESGAFEKFAAERPLATYDHLTSEWNKKAGSKISRSAIVRLVLRLGFTRKKVTKKTTEKLTKKNCAKRSAFKF